MLQGEAAYAIPLCYKVKQLMDLLDEEGLSLSQITRSVDELWRRLDEKKLR